MEISFFFPTSMNPTTWSGNNKQGEESNGLTCVGDQSSVKMPMPHATTTVGMDPLEAHLFSGFRFFWVLLWAVPTCALTVRQADQSQCELCFRRQLTVQHRSLWSLSSGGSAHRTAKYWPWPTLSPLNAFQPGGGFVRGVGAGWISLVALLFLFLSFLTININSKNWSLLAVVILSFMLRKSSGCSVVVLLYLF